MRWRKNYLCHNIRLNGTLSVLAVCWLSWNGRSNHIFSQKFRSRSSFTYSINSFITFWLEKLLKKQWRDFERGGTRGAAGRRAIRQSRWSKHCWSERSLMLILLWSQPSQVKGLWSLKQFHFELKLIWYRSHYFGVKLSKYIVCSFL